ncbi:MAG: DUF1223 domain-containing protein [Pseudomonadota bacterium]
MKLLHNLITKRLSLAAFLFVTLCANVPALEFSSGEQQTQLIELYTSEGCSSCPPADRWLSELKTSPELWQSFVPIAYHVDYWDYIGWADPYADPAHAARQRRHAAVGNLKTVYTPGFVVDGMEWRGWFKGRALPAQGPSTGRLQAKLSGDKLSVSFFPTGSHQQMIATVTILGADHISKVKRGENANRTLEHDFAVLGETSVPMKFHPDRKSFTVEFEAPKHADAKAIAVWVSPDAALRPLQATGAWLNVGLNP